MKYLLSILLTCLTLHIATAQYMTDVLGGRFQQQSIEMPEDYSGKIITTLVKREPIKQTHRAILYVHGYNDYFFQKEMAETFNDSLFNFYAIDLRKYGRSLLASQTPFEVRDLSEYFADIDTAIQIMKTEGNKEIILMGHSTGGLITALYCHQNRHNLPVRGLILNSPFLDMNQSWINENILIPVVSFTGRFLKDIKIDQGKSTAYGESLLKGKHGEWIYDTSRKFLISPPVTSAWLRAIHRGHVKVQRGLDIPCPVLVLFSDKSIDGDIWTPAHQTGDAVLDVKDIEKYGKELGRRVTERKIKNGLHDLVLSNKTSRDNTYKAIFSWMKKNKMD